MEKVIIVADTGHFKAYRVVRRPMESPRIEMIENYDILETHGRLSEKMSDGAGMFGLSGGRKGVRGYGEFHNMETENLKRVIRHLAENINRVIRKEECRQWHLAAGKKIHKRIMENLDPSVRAKLGKRIPSNLTKVKKSEILHYFGEA